MIEKENTHKSSQCKTNKMCLCHFKMVNLISHHTFPIPNRSTQTKVLLIVFYVFTLKWQTYYKNLLNKN